MRVFICHATEDKDDVVRPLAQSLRTQGYDVWFDEYALQLGDSLRREIERGLRECDFGVVVLSPNFFAKEWPQRELDSLTAREIQERRKLILPVWHRITAAAITRYSPNLADKVAVNTSEGIDHVATCVLRTLRAYEESVPRMSPEELAEFHDWAELLYSQGIARAEAEEFAEDEEAKDE